MRTRKNNIPKRVFTKKNYLSNDGMMTTVWGPSMWHYMHAMSFNYPIKPTSEQKKHYKQFVLNLQHTLPCGACRTNLKNNLKVHPLKSCHLKDRTSFSRYIYDLHEIVNKMLGKESGLTYCQVRERYEHFRARCLENKLKRFRFAKKTIKKKKEGGCTEPLYGKKSKCIIKIVPQSHKSQTLQIHNKCLKSRKEGK
jgi:hypothetical protein